MLCVTGSWDEVVDRLETFRAAGARSAVLRFAARDQLSQLEACAEIFHRRGLLG
jgi:alkanesulfonate monooxygenase SsuD/methylene tetrahydromethanopterin reductase-like flavin-dependent oxidoreductase (luciferase family)